MHEPRVGSDLKVSSLSADGVVESEMILTRLLALENKYATSAWVVTKLVRLSVFRLGQFANASHRSDFSRIDITPNL